MHNKGMDGTCDTVRIKSSVSDGNPQGYVVINEADYDPEQHELYGVEKKDPGGKGEKGNGKNGDKDKGGEGGKDAGGK